jgi:hypothetical protein
MSVLRRGARWLRARWKLALALSAAGSVVAVLALGQLSGLLALERHQGYFAPVWDQDGRHVFLFERTTTGVVWGPGWESFTPPARVYVLADRLVLLRLDSATGDTEALERFDGSPVVGRTTKHYRSRIFNHLSARIGPTASGVEFVAALNVPRVPTSETWTLTGTWQPAARSNAEWTEKWPGDTAAPDEVLYRGVELMTAPGREAFPAAVLAVEADGSHRVLVKNDDFAGLYPKGVPAQLIAERSNRARIERVREFVRVQSDLTAKYRAEGLNEGAATLRAYDAMEELGYLPKSPRLVATPLDAPPAEVRVFDIPAEYFRVGLFQDIAAAIAAPGRQVKTSTGTYLKYYDDELGPDLKAWREAGNDRFAVRTGDALYLLDVLRFERQ